jgi:hypothetical protein
MHSISRSEYVGDKLRIHGVQLSGFSSARRLVDLLVGISHAYFAPILPNLSGAFPTTSYATSPLYNDRSSTLSTPPIKTITKYIHTLLFTGADL